MTEAVAQNRLDVAAVRAQFPALHQLVNGRPLVYLDNAATTQKPASVLRALTAYYEQDNANIHRGIHTLAERATRSFEATRLTVRDFLNAPSETEIIFTRGVTESINLVASSWGRSQLQPGDEILISGLEHHSNIVPWQLIASEKGAVIKVIPVLNDGSLDMASYETLLSPRTRMVAFNHASNALGTINPAKALIDLAHRAGALVLVDGAQAASHLKVDVQDLGCDFYCISSHKLYGPTGVGVLFGKRHLLDQMPPYQGGGEMIREVSFNGTTFNDPPYKFEAGTPNIADVVAFKEALDFLKNLSDFNFRSHEQNLLDTFCREVSANKRVRLVGTSADKVSVQSFVIDRVHHFDAGQMLDARGIAVRTGHHCAQPLMDRFELEGTIRASFAVYNTVEEVHELVQGINWITKFVP
ncbi:MAG: cysteine desulfurase [Cyclobacteriaceae bacterium]|nr:cysteine desulfurase [Cyclobacteriaceae bacterium]